MGSMTVLSGLKSNNLQNSYNRKLNMTDEEYTAQVDNGKYTNYATDKAGYVVNYFYLFYFRKLEADKSLHLTKAKETKVSIGEGKLQLDLIFAAIKEKFADLYKTLLSAKDVETACKAVYESYLPARDEGDKRIRDKQCKMIYNKYHS